MQIKNVMTSNPTWLPATATIQDAARKMADLDCGFIPVGENDKLVGIVTDRDITTRAVAEGKSCDGTTVKDIMTTKVLYCCETDTVDTVVQNMQQQQVRRLVVLNNKTDKKLVGIVSVCDLVNQAQDTTNSQLIKSLSQGGSQGGYQGNTQDNYQGNAQNTNQGSAQNNNQGNARNNNQAA